MSDLNIDDFNIKDDEYYKESIRALDEMYQDNVKRIEKNDKFLFSNKDIFLWRYNDIKEYLSDLDYWDIKGIVTCVKTKKQKNNRTIFQEIVDNNKNSLSSSIYVEKQYEEEYMSNENDKLYYILIWQNGGGYTGDDYFGYIYMPLKEKNKYLKIYYNC